MLPINVLSKLGIYELEIGSYKVKVSVIDNAALIDSNITELRSLLKKLVVGFDVKFGNDNDKNNVEIAKLLILHVEPRCLIIQLDNLVSVPDCLKNFLSDESICFVGKKMKNKVESIQRYGLSCVTGVEVGDFAARVLKKPNLMASCDLSDLAKEIGVKTVTVTGLPASTPDWNAIVFTDGEIKSANLQARFCYYIGRKLLGMIN